MCPLMTMYREIYTETFICYNENTPYNHPKTFLQVITVFVTT